MTKLLRFFRPSHQHTAFSATLLLMTTVMLSRVDRLPARGLHCLRLRRRVADRRVCRGIHPARFPQLHCGRRRRLDHVHLDLHAVSGREARRGRAEDVLHHHHGDDRRHDRGHRSCTEIFAPQFVRWFVKDFTPDQIELCVHLTRILLPAQIFFYVGGVVSAVLLSHRLFLLPAFGPLIYNVFIILGGVVGRRAFWNCVAGLRSRWWAVLPDPFWQA